MVKEMNEMYSLFQNIDKIFQNIDNFFQNIDKIFQNIDKNFQSRCLHTPRLPKTSATSHQSLTSDETRLCTSVTTNETHHAVKGRVDWMTGQLS